MRGPTSSCGPWAGVKTLSRLEKAVEARGRPPGHAVLTVDPGREPVRARRTRGHNESVLTCDRGDALQKQWGGFAVRVAACQKFGSGLKSFGSDRKWFGTDLTGEGIRGCVIWDYLKMVWYSS
jgi:hypothetical protein